jgi:hypothetical protein
LLYHILTQNAKITLILQEMEPVVLSNQGEKSSELPGTAENDKRKSSDKERSKRLKTLAENNLQDFANPTRLPKTHKNATSAEIESKRKSSDKKGSKRLKRPAENNLQSPTRLPKTHKNATKHTERRTKCIYPKCNPIGADVYYGKHTIATLHADIHKGPAKQKFPGLNTKHSGCFIRNIVSDADLKYYCAFPNCTNKKLKNIKYAAHQFPNAEECGCHITNRHMNKKGWQDQFGIQDFCLRVNF